MKKALKIIAGVIGGFCFLLVVLGVIGMSMEDDPKEVDTAVVEAPKKEEKQKVSKEIYDNIVQGDSLTGEGGTTKEEVLKMLGEPDSLSESEMDIQGEKFKRENCSWRSFTNGTISVTFSNGKVSHKLWID